MPLQIPSIYDRRYPHLVADALARIPVHNPEWTNFNKSDPGVTLIELFAFLTENLLYRANQIPERNRRKFLQLLGVPLQPSASALGLVSFTNDRGPLETITLNGGIEVRAGQVPFRTDQGLDVLPVEAVVYYKQKDTPQDPSITDYYKQLYASYTLTPRVAPNVQLYRTVPLPGREGGEISIGEDTTENPLWIALLKRAAHPAATLNDVRDQLAGKTISLGVVP